MSSFYLIITKDLEKVLQSTFVNRIFLTILGSERKQDTAKVKHVKKLEILTNEYNLSRSRNVYKHVLFHLI